MALPLSNPKGKLPLGAEAEEPGLEFGGGDRGFGGGGLGVWSESLERAIHAAGVGSM